MRELKASIAAGIKSARERRNLSALELASRAGIHRNTIHRLESGQTVSVKALWLICKTLGISVDSILNHQPEIGPAQLSFKWPAKRREHVTELQSKTNRGSDVLYPLRPGLGSQRFGTTRMPARTIASPSASAGGRRGPTRATAIIELGEKLSKLRNRAYGMGA